MVELLSDPQVWLTLLTLTFLEIVLGIDNIIFISLVSNKLPAEQQSKARFIGLVLALVVRVLMLAGITWIIGFTKPLFEIADMEFSGRDLILLFGGAFLLAKSTTEIHHKVSHTEEELLEGGKKTKSYSSVIAQIVLLDIIFSFDSILTAVGMSRDLPVMIAAVIISIIVMMIFANPISTFISKHPTLQILALSFLILIGFMLCLEGFHFEVPKGYIYVAVAFSLIVEILNMRMRKKHTPPNP